MFCLKVIICMYAPASDMTALAHVIPQCTNLIRLRMEGNNMDDEAGKTLVSNLQYAQHLQVLWIDVGGMSKRNHKKLVLTIGKLTKLRVLRMYRSPYVNDLVLYTAGVVTSLNLTYQVTLDASYSDDQSDQSPLKRLLSRLKKKETTTDESVPVGCVDE